MSKLDEILKLAAERHASDVHLQAGLPPVLRILTRLVALEAATLDAAATERLIFSNGAVLPLDLRVARKYPRAPARARGGHGTLRRGHSARAPAVFSSE